MSSRKQPGFAMAKLVLTLGMGAVFVTIVWPQQAGVPKPPTALITSNERAAIAALRSIASAQALLASSVAIDTDDDGVGEYGYLGELAGTARLRIYDPVFDSPDIGPNVLSTPLLPPAFGNIHLDANGENVVQVQGYLFKMFLPDVPNLHDVDGIAEDGPPGVGGSSGAIFPDPDAGEALWCCYAWPVEDQVTGHRAFFVNQEGRVLQSGNDGRSLVYEGLVRPPAFDAAYSNKPAFPNGLTGMGAPLGNPPRWSGDGNRWTPTR